MAIKIGLDAGHGGSSTGTFSIDTVIDGLYEKDYCLELVKLIDKYLRFNNFETYLTRTEDVNPGNVSQRAKKCSLAMCDFALSVHFNGFDNENANGTECYVPYEETAADIEVGFRRELTKYFKERKPFARSCGPHSKNEILAKKLNDKEATFEATSSKKDYFGFIRDCWREGISADLIEICFLTNRKDFETYKESKEEIVHGIAKSIVEGFGKTYRKEEIVLPEKPIELPKQPEPVVTKKPKAVGKGRLNKNRVDLKF